MIFDKLANLGAHQETADYAALVNGFLDSKGDQLMNPGEWKFITEQFKVILLQSFSFDPVTLETHRKFYDLHVTLIGLDRMGVAPVDTLTVVQPYDAAKDFELHRGQDKQTIDIAPGSFLLLAPTDAHHNQFAQDGTRKLVFKIPVK